MEFPRGILQNLSLSVGAVGGLQFPYSLFQEFIYLVKIRIMIMVIRNHSEIRETKKSSLISKTIRQQTKFHPFKDFCIRTNAATQITKMVSHHICYGTWTFSSENTFKTNDVSAESRCTFYSFLFSLAIAKYCLRPNFRNSIFTAITCFKVSQRVYERVKFFSN